MEKKSEEGGGDGDAPAPSVPAGGHPKHIELLQSYAN